MAIKSQDLYGILHQDLKENGLFRYACEQAAFHLIILYEKRGYSSFTFTGSMPDAGTTRISAGISVVLAETGRKTIWISAGRENDHSRLHSGDGDSPGLSGYRLSLAAESEIICHTNLDNLDIIHGGSPKSAPGLASLDKIAGLIEYLRSQYSYVIIDAPAVGSCIDSYVLARAADSAVIVCPLIGEKNKTLMDAKAGLEKYGANIAGVVCSMVSPGEYTRYAGILPPERKREV